MTQSHSGSLRSPSDRYAAATLSGRRGGPG